MFIDGLKKFYLSAMEQPQPSPDPSSIRVLHVDDEATHRDYTKSFLEMADESIHVESVASPEDALERLESETYDCIVSDFQMPVLDGIELARRIRETSDIPFIIYTGRGSEEVAEAAFAVGIDDYIRKEVDPSHYRVLARRIRSAVEKTRSDQELRESEERYRSLVENSPTSISVTAGNKIAYVNRRRAELTGHTRSELVGTIGIDNIVPEDVELIRSRIRARESGEKVPDFLEFELMAKGGKKVRVIDYDSNITWQGSDAVMHMMQDVTLRREMEREIQSLARFPSENSDPVLRISKDGVVLYANAAARPHLKEGGSKIGSAVPDEWAEWVSGAHDSGLVDERESIYGDRLFSFSIVPVADTDYVNMYGRDITERKQMEEELRSYSEDLEVLVEQRTRELLDAERLVAAGSVAAMVGHDLRGPLQIIKNAIYLLRKDPESLEETLGIIDDSVDRATNMIEEFREQTREDPVSVAEVDLGALLERAVKEAIIPEDVNAVVEVGDGLGSVLVDALKIRRVMDNLVRNAVEAMPKGGELSVKAHLYDGGVLVEVSDTGEGVPEEVLGGLFKPFHTTKAGGLGLGLAYCKRAIEAHGGTIEAESKAGEGTKITISMPKTLETK